MFDASSLASCLKDAKVEHLIEANKTIKRIQNDKVRLKYYCLNTEKFEFLVYSDASLGNLPNGGTQGGSVIFLANENAEVLPICWTSRKIRRVVRSTLAGETLAMTDAIDMGIFVSTLFSELYNGSADGNKFPLSCITDCKSLHDAVKSVKLVTEKRLRLEVSSVKDMMEKGTVKETIWVENRDQLADCLTKKGASPYMLLQVLEQGKITKA